MNNVLVFVCPECKRTSVIGPECLGQPCRCGECGLEVFLSVERGKTRAVAHLWCETPAATESPTQPRPFRARLARYLHCDEADLAQHGPGERSQMAFWSAVSCTARHHEKPAWLIRMVLQRIHELVHGPHVQPPGRMQYSLRLLLLLTTLIALVLTTGQLFRSGLVLLALLMLLGLLGWLLRAIAARV